MAAGWPMEWREGWLVGGSQPEGCLAQRWLSANWLLGIWLSENLLSEGLAASGWPLER